MKAYQLRLCPTRFPHSLHSDAVAGLPFQVLLVSHEGQRGVRVPEKRFRLLFVLHEGTGARFAAGPDKPRSARVAGRLETLARELISKDGFDDLVFIVHSQGSLIAYDFLRGGGRQCEELSTNRPSSSARRRINRRSLMRRQCPLR